MIVCLKCRSHNDDDATHCSNCGVDITGNNGVRAGGPRSRPRRVASTSPPPVETTVGPEAPTGGGADEPLPGLPPMGGGDASEPSGPGSTASPPADTVGRVETGSTDAPVTPPDEGPAQDPPDGPSDGADESPQVRYSTAQAQPRLVVRDDVQGTDQEIIRPDEKTYDHIPEGRRPDEGEDLDEDEIAQVVRDDALTIRGQQVAAVGATVTQAVPPAGGTATLLADQIACPDCGEPNDDIRRFCCVCGTTLPAFDEPDDPDDDVIEPRDNLWRRMLGTVNKGDRDSRTHGQRMRDAGQSKLKYRARRSLGARLGGLGVLVGGLGAVLLVIGPWGDSIRDFFDDDPTPQTFETVAVEGDQPSENASDNNAETPFLVVWDESGEPVDIVVTIGEATGVRHVVVTPLPNDAPEAATLKRPEVIDILEDSEGPITLGDDGEPEQVSVTFDDSVTTFTVRVIKVFDRDWETEDVAVFGDLGYLID